MSKLTHLDEHGAARMVDVSEKVATEREAVAEATLTVSASAFDAIATDRVPKGDVLAVARVAGIMAAKKTSELIPLCHPLALSKAGIDFDLLAEEHSVRIRATVKTTGPTGVEMEALTAVSIAALTVYDMIKAIDKTAVISDVRLIAKSGGKSGDFVALRAKETRRRVVPSRTSPRRLSKASTLMDATAAVPAQQNPGSDREAFRTFMLSRRLRASTWAKDAGVAPSLVYAYLTGRLRSLPSDVARKLARAASADPQDLFR
jgi:cyclic pyranopterin phosphate synthase